METTERRILLWGSLGLVGIGGAVLVVDLIRRPAPPKTPPTSVTTRSQPMTITECGALITQHGYVYSIQDQHQALPCVTIIQRILQTMGLPVAVTGYYNAQTEAAVKRFQQSVRLPATGIVDAATWDRLTQGVPASVSSQQASTAATQPTTSGLGAHPPSGYRYIGYYRGNPLYVPIPPNTWDYRVWGPIPVANRVLLRQCAWVVIRKPVINAATGHPVADLQTVASYGQDGTLITWVVITRAYGAKPFVASCDPYVNWPGQLLF